MMAMENRSFQKLFFFRDVVSVKAMAYDLHQSLCLVDGGGVILEETTPNKIGMFHRRINVVSQKNCHADLKYRFTLKGYKI